MAITDELLTLQDIREGVENLKHPLSLPETEESWEMILNGLEGLGRLCRLGTCEHGGAIVSALRSLHRHIVGAMNSDRTRLSGAALDALGAAASGLGSEFEPILPLFFPALLALCGRTNKVVVSRAKSCVLLIIESTQLPAILTYLVQFVKDKSPTVRLIVAEGTLSCLKCFNPPDLEKESLSLAIETIIRMTVRDANANTRKVGKDVFQSYQVMLPRRVERFAAPLTPTLRKYLQLNGSVADTHRKPAPASKSVSEPQDSGVQGAMQLVKQSNIAFGPIRPVKIATPSLNPSLTIESAEPLRPIQLHTKRGGGLSRGGVPQQKPSTLATRPFVPANDAVGPQRVMRPTSTTTSVDKRDTKVVSTKSSGPSRLRAASTSSPVDPSDASRLGPSNQLGKKLQTSASIAADRNRPRDLMRPTLSQLARVRPPVTRPALKAVRGLEIRTSKPSAEGKPTAASDQTLNAKCHSAQTHTGAIEAQRPSTPCSIPLPLSPKLTLHEPCTSNLDQNDGGSPIKDATSVPQPSVTTAQPNEMVGTTHIASTEDPISTPITHDNCVPDSNLNFKTPISALLSSIQRGFDLTPCSPLSPPQHYLTGSTTQPEKGLFRLGVIERDSTTVTQP